MWVVLVNSNLEEKRDNRISELLDIKKDKVDNYLSYQYGRYSSSTSFLFAKNYKTKSGAERMISKILKSGNNSYSSKFYYLKDKDFSVRKLTNDEWNSTINHKISQLESSYNKRRNELLDKLI